MDKNFRSTSFHLGAINKDIGVASEHRDLYAHFRERPTAQNLERVLDSGDFFKTRYIGHQGQRQAHQTKAHGERGQRPKGHDQRKRAKAHQLLPKISPRHSTTISDREPNLMRRPDMQNIEELRDLQQVGL